MFGTPEYLFATAATAAASAGLTILVRHVARRFGVLDRPETDPTRKHQRAPVPLLGGLAIYGAFALVVFGYAVFSKLLVGDALPFKYLLGLVIGGGILMVGGALDDRFALPAGKQIVFPILAALTVIASGIGAAAISNPFGGVIRLDLLRVELFAVQGTPYFLTLPADAFTVLWLLGMMYTTKLLDGLDGLVAGMSVIGSVILFFVSIRPEVMQPGTAMLAAIFAGASLGFLGFNWHPARIYLGEGGSLFAGFVLGVLSIISGGKIATALLIMGIPILDVGRVMAWRVFRARRSPFTGADRSHLHFRFLAYGFSVRVTVLIFWAVSAGFGATTLLFAGRQKVMVLAVLLLLALLFDRALRDRQRGRDRPASP